jgi:hypothetical protein
MGEHELMFRYSKLHVHLGALGSELHMYNNRVGLLDRLMCVSMSR